MRADERTTDETLHPAWRTGENDGAARSAPAEESPRLVQTLRDGATVVLRPLDPADRDRIRDTLGWMSGPTRYARFFAHVERFSEAQLRYLTEIDQESHVAWLAIDPAASAVPAAGIGRMIALRDEPGAAELVITVVDAYQRRWLGTALLGLLYHRAQSAGLHTLRAIVPPIGGAFADRMRRLGAVARLRDGLVELDLPVHHDPAYLPKNPVGERLRRILRDCDRAFASAPRLAGAVATRRRVA